MGLRAQRKLKEFMISNPNIDFNDEFSKISPDPEIDCEDCDSREDLYWCDFGGRDSLFLCKKCISNYANKELPEPQNNCKTLSMRFAVFMRDGFRCVYCGRTVEDGAKLEVDHVYPKSKGGTDSMGNLVTSCWECNHGKGDVIINFRRSQGK